jgi:hypothetical protein
MNNGHRALLRVLLTAVAFLALPHISALGFGFHGTILGAVGLASIFEVLIWVSILAYGLLLVSTVGVTPRDLPYAANSAVFLVISGLFLYATSHMAPALLTLAGFLPLAAGALVLFGISALVMKPSKNCGCHSESEESQDEDQSNSK